MCYTTEGQTNAPLSAYEAAGPSFSDPSRFANDPQQRAILANRGFQLTPGSQAGFRATSGQGTPFVSRGLLQALGNGSSGVSPLQRVSPMAQLMSQPFQTADTPIRSVR